jgi:hypothetical protein
MSEDEFRFRSIRHFSARVSAQEAGWILGCGGEDVQALCRYRLLKPLGNPPPNGRKYFSTKELLRLSEDPTWLTKMTNALYKRWRDKNGSRTGDSKITQAPFYEEAHSADSKR